MGGLEEGEQPEIHFPMVIAQGYRCHMAVIHWGNMDTAQFQQASGEGQPLGAVVIAADDQHRNLPFGQTAEKIVEQSHCLGRGDALVIDISGDQHRVGLFVVDDLQNLQQDVFLIFDHGDFIDPLADVQVG